MLLGGDAIDLIEAGDEAADHLDDEALRRALDQLLNPRPSASEVAIPSSSADRAPRSAAPAEGSPGRWRDPVTGLLVAERWRELLAVEEARARRYERPWTIVQLEVAGIPVIAERMGQEAAQHILRSLAGVLGTATRRSDVFGRGEGWRLLGFLPETPVELTGPVLQRVDSRFAAAMDGILPHGLAFGVASVPAEEPLDVALSRAERQLHVNLRALLSEVPAAPEARAAPDSIETSPSTVQPSGPERAAHGGVRSALHELEALREDRLVTEDEYASKRAEILARL